MKKVLLIMILFLCCMIKVDAKESAFLKELSLTNAHLTTEFDPLVTTYTALVEEGTISLGIEYALQDPYASLLIKGNENLLEGGEVIIRVTSSDDDIMDYHILVSVSEEKDVFDPMDGVEALEVPVTRKTHHYGLAIVISSICLLAIGLVFFLLFHKRKPK